MATNPFLDQLNQLDGIVFDLHDLASTTGDATYSSDGRKISVSDIDRYDDVNNPYSFDPGTLDIVSSEYLPAVTDGAYFPPVFGVISFSNILYYDGRNYVQTDIPVQYAIRGFTEDGLLLSRVSPINGDPQDTDIRDLNEGVLILSYDGFGAGAFNFPVTFGYDPSVYVVPVCFAEGTRIETITGPVAVEQLVAGDILRTADGAERAIKWIGRMTARPSRHPRPWEVNPVRITASAFAPGVPERDLRLSPGHAVHVDGMLVPIGRLINGATIVQDETAEILYFHVELDAHDVVIAEGLPCESYLDDGNRATFVNAGDHAALHGRVDPVDRGMACAPIVTDGPRFAELRDRLLERAASLGWVKSEQPELCIVADGCEIAPIRVTGDLYRFEVPAANEIFLRSSSGVPTQVLTGVPDWRRLGVAVGELRIDDVPIGLDSSMFGQGFHKPEQGGLHAWRWTTGEARLMIAGAATIDVRITMVAPSWHRAATELRVAA